MTIRNKEKIENQEQRTKLTSVDRLGLVYLEKDLTCFLDGKRRSVRLRVRDQGVFKNTELDSTDKKSNAGFKFPDVALIEASIDTKYLLLLQSIANKFNP